MAYTLEDAAREQHNEQYMAQQEQEAQQLELISQYNPEAVGKEGPAFVPGASEEAEALRVSGGDEKYLEWARSQGLSNEDIVKMADERDSANILNTGIGGYETPFAGLEGLRDATVPVTRGLVDTGLGLGAMVSPTVLEPVKDFWHEKNPESNNPVSATVRKLSGVVIPAILAPQAIVPRLAAAPFAASLPTAVKTTAAAAARIGIDTTIVAASTSAEEENAAKALNDAFGWNIWWATREGAGPDERRLSNLFENVGFAAAAELVTGAFALRTFFKNRPKANKFAASWIHKHDIKKHELLKGGVKPGTQVEWDPGLVAIPKTAEAVEELTKVADNIEQQTTSPAIKEIDDQIDALGLLDELGEADELRLAELVTERGRIEVDEMPFDDALSRNIDETKNARANSLTDEAAELSLTNQGEYNPILHDPAEAQARAVTNTQGDVLGAMVDHHRILHDVNTTNGRARAVLPTQGMRRLATAATGTERGQVLEEITAAMTPSKNVEWLIEGKWKATPEDLKEAVDAKVAEIYNMDTKALAEKMNRIKNKVTLGQKFLSDEDFIEYSQAFRTVFDEMYDPNKIRASALATQNAADNVADAARAAESLGETLDVTRQHENMLNNLAVVAKETRANRYLWGYQGKLLDMAKDKSPRVTEKLKELVEGFNEGLQTETAKAAEVVNTLKQIGRENPMYLNAFTKAFDMTNGKVDDLAKLHRWAEKNISLRKAFIDLDPSTPSLVAKGLQGVRYNSLLNGLAPIRAFTGNTILTIGKPISAIAGSAWSGSRQADFKRALYTYGGVVENFQRALKHMSQEWDYVLRNPEQAMLRGRSDVKFAQTDNFEVLDSMAEAWRMEYERGGISVKAETAVKIGLLNLARATSWYNNLNVTRWGVNAMHAIDGFTNSMMASGAARAKAYDTLLESTNGVIKQDDFAKLQQQLYSNSFDETGLLTDTAAKHAASEIALNIDNDVVKRLEGIIDIVPALKPLFMFPRTGLNGLEVAWTYNPASALGMSMGRARQVFRANTPAEVAEALKAHGINEVSEEAFQALKNEYRGRQMMGASIVMGAGLMAISGNLTGNGSHKKDERDDMKRIGWKPNSIRLNGTWYSYQGLEPFQQILSLVADTVYNAERVDSSITEERFQKIWHALTMNVTNQTFLSGLRPLAGLLSGDLTQIKRFGAGWTDPLVPFYWSGARSILNKAISPQLKDVRNEMDDYHKNYSKFLFNGNDYLKDQLDVYTGKPINYTEPLTATINSMLPFFRNNGGHEPWREWLIGTGWDNLNTLRTNRFTGQPLTPTERYWINNWVAQHAGLREQVIELMEQDKAGKFMHQYKNARGNMMQKEFPINKTYIHDRLNKMHNDAFNIAWKALEQENSNYADMSILRKYRNQQLQEQDTQGAAQTQSQMDQLLKLN